MNSHLNLFRTYTKVDRDNQLENDLTRALAVCLQEEPLFLNNFLKIILSAHKDPEYFTHLYATYSPETKIEVDIQKQVSSIGSFKYLFAASISATELDVSRFFDHQSQKEKQRVTDLFIRYKDVVIICEVKPNGQDVASQLYNQAWEATKGNGEDMDFTETVFPVDLNWERLMRDTVIVSNFQKSLGRPSRFLTNFIELIKRHDTSWLPIVPFFSLKPDQDKERIDQRLDAALSKMEGKLEAQDRMGLVVNFGWASEIIFWLEEIEGEYFMRVAIWPGNTKQQGWALFGGGKQPRFKESVKVGTLGKTYKLNEEYHLKFTNSHGRWIADLTGGYENTRKPLLTYSNFEHRSGRQKRGDDDWRDLQDFLDAHFKETYDWRALVRFKERLVKSNYTQINLSFGYGLSILIPFRDLQEVDKQQSDVSKLVAVIDDIRTEYENIVEFVPRK